MTLPDWLADPGLKPLWVAIHEQLERRGRGWRGSVSVTLSSPGERRAVALLLGRSGLGDRVRIEMTDLDERTANVGGIETVVELEVGEVRDRRSAREMARAEREAPVSAARAVLGQVGWAEDWLAVVRRTAPAPDDAVAAARLLAHLAVAWEVIHRQDLAVQATGDAHGLDDGTVVANLVLRGLALASGIDSPTTAAARRDLWAAAGVLLDGVSSTCLVHRLPLAAGPLGDRLADGEPLHITSRDLARDRVCVEGKPEILVCENPRVLEAIAQEGLEVPVVCVSGNPNLVTVELLSRLQAGSAILRYHGDFDWPGIAIANRLVTSVGVQPWLMSAEEYHASVEVHGLPLRGATVEPCWDRALGEAMRARGTAVHEEAVLPRVLAVLAGGGLDSASS